MTGSGITTIVTVVATLACSPAAFFPDGVFDPQEVLHEYYADCYATYLCAMREPSLLQAAGEKGRHVYRFLWLRSFDEPVSVRLEIARDGAGTLTLTTLEAGEAAGPVRVGLRRTSRPSARAVRRFLARLERQRFWTLPSHGVSVGVDGSHWILEGVRDGRYHVVDRWSPDAGRAFRATCLELLELSGLQISRRQIY